MPTRLPLVIGPRIRHRLGTKGTPIRDRISLIWALLGVPSECALPDSYGVLWPHSYR